MDRLQKRCQSYVRPDESRLRSDVSTELWQFLRSAGGQGGRAWMETFTAPTIGGRLMSGRSAIRTLPLAVSSSRLDCVPSQIPCRKVAA